ncbi:MAG: SDR family NAD(P)-dependent oxidoreductase [Pseudomonadales bacterium]
MNDVLTRGRTAVITGGASGIGLAAAEKFAQLGMNIAIADASSEDLDTALTVLNQSGVATLGLEIDVADFDAVCEFRDQILKKFGDIAVLMNNAGISAGGGTFENLDGWRRVMEVNLWGVIHGAQAFVPALIKQDRPAMVINTGSKQGITNPPGNPAYNVTKAGVRSLTESLAHELRELNDCPVSAHLLIPGFTYTGMIRRFVPEKPPTAWTPDQVVDYMIEALSQGDFYILCPDNDVTTEMDHRRIQWNVGDIVGNRPALSRWHIDYADEYEEFIDQ